MPLPEGLSPPLLIALAAVWCRLVYALCTPNLNGAFVALATVAAWRWAVQLKRRRTETVVQPEAAPTPEVAVEKARRAEAAGITVDQLDEKALDDEALNTIQRCAKLATNDSEDESVEGGFRLVLTFDLAVTPTEAFAKFWENDYYARVLEEKCNNEDVTFEPWRNGHPKTRKVNTRHPLAKDISMPGISFSIPTAKIQRVFFDVEDMAFCIVEESRFEKIPYARALAVETVWLFERKGSSIFGRVYYRCVFDTTVLSVPKWIQSYCNAHTREELIVTYGHWISAARELLEAETGVRSRVEQRRIDGVGCPKFDFHTGQVSENGGHAARGAAAVVGRRTNEWLGRRLPGNEAVARGLRRRLRGPGLAQDRRVRREHRRGGRSEVRNTR